MADDPFVMFEDWFAEAKAAELCFPEAVAVATSTPDGRPSVRMVLMKDHGTDGFTFFTHGDSRKGSELAANPHASLLFHWKSLMRQVRIDGRVEEVSAAESEAYFATRSRESQLGAVASRQSRPLASREQFEREYAEAAARFEGKAVDKPGRWTGFRVIPEKIEFWQDRPFRLHDRLLFVRDGEGWTQSLLYP
ncbi:pyridoxamine 5'-phosphate oxidase [Sphingomonas sp. LY29]|uniref:pyridoxamine 5'-phosphate oxidase n=1 Tax=Sphingomonas sp. LY29 TaxID=3095341 RepID=UPI002D778DA4|nr:pyridoxamine 5'-phosphate oxidase [Sphingomonas sp. LY29]WRP26881.1 pyridoxamine 5'-phosphate oxidase [Sphingomonas sp. LY29]